MGPLSHTRAERQGFARGLAVQPADASMGPPSFESGKWPRRQSQPRSKAELQWGRPLSRAESDGLTPLAINASRLQWGRPLSRAESWSSSRACPGSSCFNGAALFRERKGRRAAAAVEPLRSFNGAALFRERKDDPA